MLAKRFFFVSVGLLCLALAYYVYSGATKAMRLRATASAVPDSIVTRRLVVTDELVVRDVAGRQRATITVDGGGPHLSLSDEDGYPTVFLSGSSDQNQPGDRGPYGGYLAFYDRTHKRSAQLGYRQTLGADGWPMVQEDADFVLYDYGGLRKEWAARR